MEKHKKNIFASGKSFDEIWSRNFLNIVQPSTMNLCTKLDKNQFTECMISDKNTKRTFLLLETASDDFFRILFYMNDDSHGIYHYTKSGDHLPNSLIGEE